MDFNYIICEGVVHSRSPELFYGKLNDCSYIFNLKISNSYYSNGKKIEDYCVVSFHAFNKVAINCFKYLKVGSKVKLRARFIKCRDSFEAVNNVEEFYIK